MELIIGRTNDGTNRLHIQAGKKETVYGSSGSVMQSVSRMNHLSLEDKGQGQWLLKNLNPANETFVNGMSVDTARVKTGDRIELGSEHYRFEWDSIAEVTPTTINLTPLKYVWENYHNERLRIQKQQGKFNAISRLTGVLSMVGMVFAIIGGTSDHVNVLRLVIIGAAILLTIIVSIVAYINASKVPQKLDALDRQFQMSYVCPNKKCGMFMGNQPYHVLAQRSQCPHCKAKYSEK